MFRVLFLGLLIFAACSPQPKIVYVDVDAGVVDVPPDSAQEAAWWRPWGRACVRTSYGATGCVATDQEPGWCVMPDGNYLDAICMPACLGNNYLCAYGHPAYNEGNECYCAR